ATSLTAAVAAGVVQQTTAQAPSSASWRASSAARVGEPASSSTSTSTGKPKTPPFARTSLAHPAAARDCEAPAARASPEREAITPTWTAGAAPWAFAQDRTRVTSSAMRRSGTASLLTSAPVSAVRAGEAAHHDERSPARTRGALLVRPTGFEPVTLGLG